METRRFLEELCASDGLAVPDAIRTSARQLLRHYPGAWHIDIAAVAWPTTWAPASPQQAKALSYLELVTLAKSQAANVVADRSGVDCKPMKPDDATN